jgi:hypothetical protein
MSLGHTLRIYYIALSGCEHRGGFFDHSGERGGIAFPKLYSGTANLPVCESKVMILTSLGVDDNPFESV